MWEAVCDLALRPAAHPLPIVRMKKLAEIVGPPFFKTLAELIERGLVGIKPGTAWIRP